MIPSALSPLSEMTSSPTWQWLAGLWEQADEDWLGQEIFDIMQQASTHGDIEALVCCQVSVLA